MKNKIGVILGVLLLTVALTGLYLYNSLVTNHISKDVWEKGKSHMFNITVLEVDEKKNEIPNEIDSFKKSISGKTFTGNDKVFIDTINRVDSLYDENLVSSILNNISDDLDRRQTELKIALLRDEGCRILRSKKVSKMLEFNETFDQKFKEISSENMDKLVIVDGWKWENEGDYTYIRGRVKNISDMPIDYFKITAEYMDDNGSVLDTEYTNSSETIRPGNQKEFEISHKYSSEYSKVRIFVDEGN